MSRSEQKYRRQGKFKERNGLLQYGTKEFHSSMRLLGQMNSSGKLGCQWSEIQIAQLVAQVYETSPPALRINLLEQLLKPLGVLSLVAIADGIFAKIRFSSGSAGLPIRFEDVQKVQANDVIALVERVQQGGVGYVDGLVNMLTVSPVVVGSAAAALLVAVLMQRARTRRADDRAINDSAPVSGDQAL